MKIEVLGPGCVKCEKIYEIVQRTLKEIGKEAEVSKVKDIKSIMQYGILMTPAGYQWKGLMFRQGSRFSRDPRMADKRRSRLNIIRREYEKQYQTSCYFSSNIPNCQSIYL